jgi:hypothetical protein
MVRRSTVERGPHSVKDDMGHEGATSTRNLSPRYFDDRILLTETHAWAHYEGTIWMVIACTAAIWLIATPEARPS